MSQNWILKISITIFTFDLKDVVQGHNKLFTGNLCLCEESTR